MLHGLTPKEILVAISFQALSWVLSYWYQVTLNQWCLHMWRMRFPRSCSPSKATSCSGMKSKRSWLTTLWLTPPNLNQDFSWYIPKTVVEQALMPGPCMLRVPLYAKVVQIWIFLWAQFALNYLWTQKRKRNRLLSIRLCVTSAKAWWQNQVAWRGT